MGGSQMLLTIGGVVLFGIAILGIHSGIQSHQRTQVECEVLSQALLHAERFIEEARTRAFDEVCVSKVVSTPGELTPPDSLGPNQGESYPAFNDVDDFHGLNLAWQENGVDFKASIVVDYMDGTLPEHLSDVEYRTFKKHFTVRLTSSWLKYAVVLNHIFTYY